jgi:hypothetical protein
MNPAIDMQRWNEHSVRVGTKRITMNVGAMINLVVGAMKSTHHDNQDQARHKAYFISSMLTTMLLGLPL